MSSNSVDERVAEAVKRWNAIDDHDKAVETEKWGLAELLWKLHTEDGLSKSELGRRLGRSHNSVGRYIAVWKTRCRTAQSSDSTFTEVYYEVRGPEGSRQGIADREVRKAIRERPEAVAEEIAKAEPDTQRRIADAIVTSPTVEPSLEYVATPKERQPRPMKSIGQTVEEATFGLWDAGQRLMDEVPSGEERVRIVASAEKAQRLAAGIAMLLNSGQVDDAFRDLVAELEEA